MQTAAAVTPDEMPQPVSPSRWQTYLPIVVLGLAVATYLVVFGTLTWRQQSNFGTFGFDQGFFDQEIWLAAHFKATFVTIGGIGMWANHINPVIYLLVPFYWLGAGPHFLYVIHTLGFALAAVPLWLIGREKLGDWWALGPALMWLLYPSVQWVNWWHFHPESLAVVPLLMAWWFAGRKQWRWYAVCLAIVLATKEDAALTVMAFGAVVAIRHNKRVGLWTLVAALAWFGICMEVITPLTRGTGQPFYADRFATLGQSTNEIAYNLVRHPSRARELIFASDRHSYYLRMFAPVAFIALLDPVVLLIAVPALFVNTLSIWPYAHQIRYQYQISVSVGIFLATIEAMSGRRRSVTRRALVAIGVVAALASSIAWGPSPLNADKYTSGIWFRDTTPRTNALEAAVRMVPSHAGVTASYSVVPHMSQRTQIYEWPNPWVRFNYTPGYDKVTEDPNKVDWLVLEDGLNPNFKWLFEQLTRPGGEFEVLANVDGAIVAKRVRLHAKSDVYVAP